MHFFKFSCVEIHSVEIHSNHFTIKLGDSAADIIIFQTRFEHNGSVAERFYCDHAHMILVLLRPSSCNVERINWKTWKWKASRD